MAIPDAHVTFDSQRTSAGRASDPNAEPKSGIRPRPFAPAPSGGVAGAISSNEQHRSSTHGRTDGHRKPRFRSDDSVDIKPHSCSGRGAANTGSTASVGNTAHLKKLEQSWTSSLAQPDASGNVSSGPEVYKSGYSVDLMSSRELMELRRNIEAALDVRGVQPTSTYGLPALNFAI